MFSLAFELISRIAPISKVAVVCFIISLTSVFPGYLTAQDWCETAGGCDEYISRVTLANLDNSSYCVGYSDYTSMTADMIRGRNYLITIEIGNAYSSDSGGVWIDWNHDYVFNEMEERVPLDVSGGYGPYTGIIHVPSYIDPTEVRLRVRLCYSQTPYPCGITNFGEVEDYKLNILSGPYHCGDTNGDDEINIADAVAIINYVFKDGPAPDPLEAGDANCEGDVNVADAVSLINYIFLEGPEPCCP
jgi:hypothetical protein